MHATYTELTVLRVQVDADDWQFLVVLLLCIQSRGSRGTHHRAQANDEEQTTKGAAQAACTVSRVLVALVVSVAGVEPHRLEAASIWVFSNIHARHHSRALRAFASACGCCASPPRAGVGQPNDVRAQPGCRVDRWRIVAGPAAAPVTGLLPTSCRGTRGAPADIYLPTCLPVR